jgi:hypothetical protein
MKEYFHALIVIVLGPDSERNAAREYLKAREPDIW